MPWRLKTQGCGYEWKSRPDKYILCIGNWLIGSWVKRLKWFGDIYLSWKLKARVIKNIVVDFKNM